MQAKDIILLNWGIIQPGNYPLGQTTILKGETGIGKTTLQDAYQLVMTANLRDIARYNAAQEDATERRGGKAMRRSPEEYALGAEEGAYARHASTTFVAVTFESSEMDPRQMKPFTAIAAIEASLNVASATRRAARLDHLFFLIVDEAAVRIDDLILGEEELVPVQKLEHHLRQKYPGQVTAFRADHGDKHEYLLKLYSRLNGRDTKTGGLLSQHEAIEAAKSWAKSIAYRKLENVNDLVRNEVLEERPLADQVEEVSKTLAHLTEVSEEAKRLDANRILLEQTVDAGTSTTKMMEAYVVVQYADPLRVTNQILDEEKRKKKSLEEAKKTLEDLAREAEVHEVALKGLDSELRSLNLTRDKIPGAAEKDRLTETISAARKSYATARTHAIAGLKSSSVGTDVAGEISAAKPKSVELRVAAEAVAKALRAMRNVDPNAILKDLEEVAFNPAPERSEIARIRNDVLAMEAGQEALLDSIFGQDGYVYRANQVSGVLRDKNQELRTQLAELRVRRAKISQGGSDYPKDVLKTLDMLERELPASKPKVLCDLIEPLAGSKWMNAIEGYIGAARFNLIVERGYELDATRKLREHHANGSVRIVQADRVLKKANAPVAANSILTELLIRHPVAEAFMISSFGTVLKLDNEDDVRTAARGVTINGLASGANTQYNAYLGDEKLVFGMEAKRLAARRLEDEERQKDETIQVNEELIQSIATFQAKLRKAVTSQARASEQLAGMMNALDQEAAAQASLANLDLEKLEEIEAKIKAKEEEIGAVRDKQSENNKRWQQVMADRNTLESALEVLAERSDREQGRLKEAADLLHRICGVDPSLEADKLLAQAEEESERKNIDPNQRRTGAWGNYIQQRVRLENALKDYNMAVAGRASEMVRYDFVHADASDADTVVASYAVVVQTLSQVHAVLKRHREIEIEANRAKLEQARQSFNSTLVTSICVTVKSNVDEGLTAINRINDKLATVRFGEDWFQIIEDKAKEFWGYYEFFNAVSQMGENLEKEDLFTTARLEEKHRKTLEQLGTLLQSKNAVEAKRELERIVDYRNYRTYDVERHNRAKAVIRISEWGKRGSGGQLETAGYVLRFTVLANKLKHHDRKGRHAHLRFLILDEAFQNMDEERTRAMLRFIRDDLKLQVMIALPMQKVNGIIDEFDHELAFSRSKTPSNGESEIDYITQIDSRRLNRDEFAPVWNERRTQVVREVELRFDSEAVQ